MKHSNIRVVLREVDDNRVCTYGGKAVGHLGMRLKKLCVRAGRKDVVKSDGLRNRKVNF